MTVFRANTKSITAGDTFTDSMDCKSGSLALSISGAWEGTVTVQRSFDAGVVWFDAESFESNIETTIEDPISDVLYRVGMKSGDHINGTAEVGVYK